MRYKKYYLKPQIHLIVTTWRPEGIEFIEDPIDTYTKGYLSSGYMAVVYEPKNDIYIIFNHKSMHSTLLIPETSKYFNFDFIQQKMSPITHLAQNAKDREMMLFNLREIDQRLSHIANKVLATVK